MSGYEVARAFRDDDQFKGATLIAASGYGQGKDRLRTRQEGFDHHLTKPIDFDELLALLRNSARQRGVVAVEEQISQDTGGGPPSAHDRPEGF
jgi:two-component system CheB/CheR fusion protein